MDTLLISIKSGDVIGFSADAPCLSGVINVTTLGWPFPPRQWRGLSHIGIVVENVFGEKRILESTTLYHHACEFCHTIHDGQQLHKVEPRIRAYPGAVWLYPIAHELIFSKRSALWRYAERTHGTPYDYQGAIDSRTLCCGWLNWMLREPDLRALFCSEGVAEALHEVGRFDDYNASRWSPNRLARYLVSRRITDKPIRLK